MLKQILIAATLVATAGATASPAHAGKSKQEEALLALTQNVTGYLATAFEPFWPDSEEGLRLILAKPSCTGLVEAARKAGVPEDAKIAIGSDKHPKAVKSGSQYEITLADVPWVCEVFDKRLATEPVAIAIRKAAAYQKSNPSPPTAESVASYSRGAADNTIKAGRQCLAAIDKLVAAGTPASDSITLEDRTTKITYAEGKVLCQYQIDRGTEFNARVAEVQDAKRAVIAAKYEALGVKGERLELFIEYDGVYFYGKGCVIVDDIKKQVKAKVLFHWLENSDYTHTIRKYTFKGNKYKVSEKTYATEAKAYKGCK